MAFTLIVKNSVTAGKIPTASQIEKGELAINLTDHKLYSKGASDEIFEIGAAGDTPSGGTGDRPSGPSLGDLYFDTDLDALLYWNGSEWVPVGTEAIGLNDLTDVDTSGVTDGMVLAYNGSSWVPYDPATFQPQAGRALTYNDATNPDTLNADIATETDLGVVSVGDGLEVSLLGELSVDLSNIDVNADLEYVPNGNNDATITNTAGDDATVPIAIPADSDALPTPTTGTAGLFTGLEKEKLAGIEPGAQVNNSYDKTESDDRYLRIDADAPDQTRVSGKATFAELTSHGDGVNVTGGAHKGTADALQLTYNNNRSEIKGTDTGWNIALYAGGINVEGENNRTGYVCGGMFTNVKYGPATDAPHGFSDNADVSQVSGRTRYASFNADVNNVSFTAGATERFVGFNSHVEKDTTSGNNLAYNFYAEGDAPNFFKGLTEHDSGISLLGGTSATANIYRTGTNYIEFGGNNRTLASFATNITSVGNGVTFGHPTCQLSTSVSDINLIKIKYENGGHGGGQNLALISNSIEVNTDAQIVRLYQADSGAQQSGKLYGYYSGINASDSSDAAFNFYASGDAPNFFEGNVTSNGTIGFIGAFSLRMETDDPAAFQTTYTTDGEGNQVEQQEYIGTTEDLLAIIKDLRARVAALEAANELPASGGSN